MSRICSQASLRLRTFANTAFFFFQFAKGGGGGGQRGQRQDWQEVPKVNEKYERYYNDLGVVPEEEREAFWEALKRDLPNSFRFTGSRGYVIASTRILAAQTSSY
jgi:hypothetical protein